MILRNQHEQRALIGPSDQEGTETSCTSPRGSAKCPIPEQSTSEMRSLRRPSIEPSIFWDQLIQLIEEGKVVPVVGQDLLTIPESNGRKLLYPFLAEKLAVYLKVSTDDLPEGAELNEVALTLGHQHRISNRFLVRPSRRSHGLQRGNRSRM